MRIMNKSERFMEPFYSLAEFGYKIWVKCPACNEKGLVKRKIEFNNNVPVMYSCIFHCTNCNLIHKYSGSWYQYREIDQTWYGPVRGRTLSHCKFCGTQLAERYAVIAIRAKKEDIEPIAIKCQQCQKERSYDLNWYGYTEAKPRDPCFGMELWLQIPVKGNTLWAYNLEHIEYLQKYIDSKLRNKSHTGSHFSLVCKLPRWMILAQNRDLIMRKLCKLKKKGKNIK